MIFKDILSSSRKIDSRGANISRTTFFNGLGIKDPYQMDPALLLVDVCSSRDTSLYSQVKKEVKCEITQRNVLRQLVDNDVNERLKDIDQLESFGWVEKYIGADDKISYKIIFVAKKMCGARFTLCKELMHILTDTVDGAEGGSEAMLKSAFKWKENIPEEGATLDDETVGFYHAIESMLPWSLREQFNAVREDFGKNTKEDCDMKIAQTFMMPAKVINHICDEGDNDSYVPYYGFSYRMNATMNSDEV